MVFDDYFWSMEKQGQQDLINMPKMAIDSFTSLFQRKICFLNYAINQIYLLKTAN